jgi:hypothetical protein
MLTCICINCGFYSSCWINNALLNFPINYQILKNNISDKIRKDNITVKYIPIMLQIRLNVNLSDTFREPDIIFCDGFLEKPGRWLI